MEPHRDRVEGDARMKILHATHTHNSIHFDSIHFDVIFLDFFLQFDEDDTCDFSTKTTYSSTCSFDIQCFSTRTKRRVKILLKMSKKRLISR